MQIMIDTDAESVHGLELAADFILTIAASKRTPDVTVTTAPSPHKPWVGDPVKLDGNFPKSEAPPTPVATLVPPPPPPSSLSVPSLPIATVIDTALPRSVPSTASVSEYDSSGMRWDARIHQRGKAQKKDGTWKLQKGIDQSLVENVVMQLSSELRAVPSAPSVSDVPPPPPPPSVPEASGPSHAEQFKAFIEKVVAAKIPPLKVVELVQRIGAPNLQELNKMPHLIPEASKAVDLFLLGL